MFWMVWIACNGNYTEKTPTTEQVDPLLMQPCLEPDYHLRSLENQNIPFLCITAPFDVCTEYKNYATLKWMD